MKYSLMAAATTIVLGTGANAASITVQTFTDTGFGNLVTGNTVVEDFETPGNLTKTFEGTPKNTGAGDFGELEDGTSLFSKVGSFTGLGVGGGVANGTTCGALDLNGDNCTNIALQYDPAVNGQGNIVPMDGDWSINAADTLGIEWSAFLAGGKNFTSLFFAIRDAADQNAKLTITAAGETVVFEGLGNNNEQLVKVNFGGAVNFATIRMENSRTNDSFTIDGASINAVPLPAPALMLLGGLGLMAGLRRRRKAA